MLAFEILGRPRAALALVASRPRLATGLVGVVATGVISGAIEVLASVLVGSTTGLILSALLPLFFVGYWLLDAWLVDAGAGLSGKRGRRRAYLGVSGLAFVPLITFALLSLLEAVAMRTAGDAVASALGWLTLPILGWFLALMSLAIGAVYDLPALNAFALALLPLAAISAALLFLALVLGALHAAHVI